MIVFATYFYQVARMDNYRQCRTLMTNLCRLHVVTVGNFLVELFNVGEPGYDTGGAALGLLAMEG